MQMADPRPGCAPAPAVRGPPSPVVLRSAAGPLRVASRHLPRALVGRDARRALASVAGRLPAALLDGFYLECRTAPDAATVDYIIRVGRSGRRILAGRNHRIRLSPGLTSAPGWRRLRRLCRLWSDDASPGRHVASLWLEFDVGPGSGGGEEIVRRPSVFLGTDRSETSALAPADGADLAADLLRPLVPVGDRRAGRALLTRCVERLPAVASVPYLGVMLGRSDRRLRLYVAGIPARDLPSRLGEAGWPGDGDELGGYLDLLGSADRVSMAHVDIAGGILADVGVEYVFRRGAQLRGRFVEREFLDRLVDVGLCSPAKRDALLLWPGHTVENLRHQLWPSVLHRRVNCVKLLFRGGRRPEVKSYLWTSWPPLARGRTERGDAKPGST